MNFTKKKDRDIGLFCRPQIINTARELGVAGAIPSGLQ